ncbi:late embryogenesis abundant protein D-34 isoform X2 [Cicer arietinum]|uniref:Late embryogenesis abundant protein D-34 isoform X2 n=1 Tax=Cicer arietinum TaxID=3827 RepID=A0A1S2XWZ2_CICAR|nr:late embryogenesis abundant protein D-34 isoform X2 [Cicer arietinum]
MSQEQPRRDEEGIKYGDVFNVQGDIGRRTVAPVDAAMMQKAETETLGKTQKGGAASVMMSAAMKNERDGIVGHDDVSEVAADGGVSVTDETDDSGNKVISESIGGQVVGQFSQKGAMNTMATASLVEETGTGAGRGITIGEALEATVLTAGNKAVEWSDAAAIQAAEVRATGRTNIVPGGVAAAAQSAATLNARTTKDEDKTKLADVLADATSKLPADRAATRRDAEGVTGAEMRNDPYLTTHPGGVSASVAAAARLNQNNNN